MVTAHKEDNAATGPPEERGNMNGGRTNGSDTSSQTRADGDGEGLGPHGSHHPHFGANQVISNNQETNDLPDVAKAGTYDKVELTEDMCYDELGYSFSSRKKWCV